MTNLCLFERSTRPLKRLGNFIAEFLNPKKVNGGYFLEIVVDREVVLCS